MLAPGQGVEEEDEIKSKFTVCGVSEGTFLSSSFLCCYFKAVFAINQK